MKKFLSYVLIFLVFMTSWAFVSGLFRLSDNALGISFLVMIVAYIVLARSLVRKLLTWLAAANQKAKQARAARVSPTHSHQPANAISAQPEPTRGEREAEGDYPIWNGYPLYMWQGQMSDLKKNDLEAARDVAYALMETMMDAARENPLFVAPHYVTQVAIIEAKLKNWHGVEECITRWLNEGHSIERRFEVDLLKRLSRARRAIAQEAGDRVLAEGYAREFAALLAEGKELGSRAAGVSDDLWWETAAADRVESRDLYRARLDGSRVQFDAGLVRRSSRGALWHIADSSEIAGLDDYWVVDFETANRERVSACQISLIRMRHGRECDAVTSLLRPPAGCGGFEFTYLHGINAGDVCDAPSWGEFAPAVRAALGERAVVWAHNAQFDAGVWKALDECYGVESFPWRFLCSYRTAQRMVPGLPDYKLPTVVDHFSPSYVFDHHKAEADARAAAIIVEGLRLLAR